MSTLKKDRLARSGDYSKRACAIRTRAAIESTNLSQAEFARRSDQTPTAVGNSVSAESYPSRKTMLALYRQHRIDHTFIMTGDYAHLPSDVQERLFSALEAAENGQDPAAGSD